MKNLEVILQLQGKLLTQTLHPYAHYATGGNTWCPLCGNAGTFDGGLISVNDMSGTRTSTPVDVSTIEIYDINSSYLKFGKTNSFLSEVDHSIPTKNFLSNDGTEYSWQLADGMTRTFLMEGSTCEIALSDF